MRPELVALEGGAGTLVIRGRQRTLDPRENDATYRISETARPVALRVLGHPVQLIRGNWQGPPVIFEDGEYDIYLTGHGDLELSCDNHPGAVERISVFPSTDAKSTIHLRSKLSSEVGLLELTLRERGRVALRLRLEVYPLKIGYKTDYLALIADIDRVASNLVFASMAKTGFLVQLSPRARVADFEWFTILRTLLQDLLRTVDVLNKRPTRSLQGQIDWKPADRARTIEPAALRSAFLRRENQVAVSTDPMPRGALSIVPVRAWSASYDTPANRFVRRALKDVVARLLRIHAWIKFERSRQAEMSSWAAHLDRWSKLVDEMLPQLRRRLTYPLIAEAGDRVGARLPAQMQRQPEYARFFSLTQSLRRGLAVSQTEFTTIGSKPIWQLYEYWCYIALLEILGRRLSLVASDIVELEANASRVTIRKGIEGSVLFHDRGTGRDVRVIYNRIYRTPTTSQRPDTVIHIDLGNELHVFDAKYRVERSAEYIDAYGGKGPNLDDVNVMHRYKDAIVSSALPGHPRLVTSAVVLFPSQGRDYLGHRFERSIRSVGVGALPFLPSQTEFVARRIEQILEAALD